MQETFSEPKDKRVWKNEWRGDVFFSHGSNHSKGVCILVNPSIVINVENSYKDIDGRIIAIDVTCNGVNLSICNVYALTSCQSQGKFLQILNEFMTSNLKCQFDENWHQFFPHFFAQNNQFNRKTFFDVNKIGYNHSSGREKLLQTYEFPVRH